VSRLPKEIAGRSYRRSEVPQPIAPRRQAYMQMPRIRPPQVAPPQGGLLQGWICSPCLRTVQFASLATGAPMLVGSTAADGLARSISILPLK
jgi:hypothetical protein